MGEFARHFWFPRQTPGVPMIRTDAKICRAPALILVPLLALAPALALSGCSSATTGSRSDSDSARQDQALSDPMNYQLTPPTVSNHDSTSFDRQGFNRDMNDVINP
jgi:hypothetical protein